MNCEKLEKLDTLKGCSTITISDCPNLKTLNVENCNLHHLFIQSCYNLTTITLIETCIGFQNITTLADYLTINCTIFFSATEIEEESLFNCKYYFTNMSPQDDFEEKVMSKIKRKLQKLQLQKWTNQSDIIKTIKFYPSLLFEFDKYNKPITNFPRQITSKYFKKFKNDFIKKNITFYEEENINIAKIICLKRIYLFMG